MAQEQQQETKEPQVDVLIGLLSYRGEFRPQMWDSLENMIRYTHRKGYVLAIRKCFGSMICRSRNIIASRAIDINARYVLFIDSDMVFDEDSLVRLLDRKEKIVGGICTLASQPYSPVAKRIDKNGNYRIAHDVVNGGLFRNIDATGTAFLLIDTEVFRRLKKPWFAMPPYGEEVMSEDIYFCKIAKEAGYNICIDSDVVIGHLGERPFSIYDYKEYREEWEKANPDKSYIKEYPLG